MNACERVSMSYGFINFISPYTPERKVVVHNKIPLSNKDKLCILIRPAAAFSRPSILVDFTVVDVYRFYINYITR